MSPIAYAKLRKTTLVLAVLTSLFLSGVDGVLAQRTEGTWHFEAHVSSFPPAGGWISVIDAKHIWVGLAHTADAGVTWTTFRPAAPPPIFPGPGFQGNVPPELHATVFVTDTTGFMREDGVIWATRDGGLSWAKVFGDRRAGVWRNKAGLIAVVGNETDRSQTVYSSSDQGRSWAECGRDTPSDLSPSGIPSFISGTVGWSPVSHYGEDGLAVGRNGVARTDDGGCHWHFLSWYDEDRVLLVTFADQSAGLLLPIDLSPISRTLDGGLHWEHTNQPLPSYHPEGAYMKDRTHGWVLGSSGLLGKGDSGMFFTADLGKTWQSITTEDLKANRGAARDIPLEWADGYLMKMLQQRK